MIKITALGIAAAAFLTTSIAFAGEKEGDHSCCTAKTTAGEKTACTDFSTFKISAEQKAKLETWQAECMKAGCTKESRRAFFQQAKGILSAEQFAKLKAECKKKTNGTDKTQT